MPRQLSLSPAHSTMGLSVITTVGFTVNVS